MEPCDGLEGAELSACNARNAAKRADISQRVKSAPLPKIEGEVSRQPARALSVPPEGDAERLQGEEAVARPRLAAVRIAHNIFDVAKAGSRKTRELLGVLSDKTFDLVMDGVARLEEGAKPASTGGMFMGESGIDAASFAPEGVIEDIEGAAAQLAIGALEGTVDRAIVTPATAIEDLANKIVSTATDPFKVASREANFRLEGHSPLAARNLALASLTREKIAAQEKQDETLAIIREAFQSAAEALPGDPDGGFRTAGTIVGGFAGDFAFYATGGMVLGKVAQARAAARGTTSIFAGAQATKANIFRRNVLGGLPGDLIIGSNKETSFAQFMADETGNDGFQRLSDNTVTRMMSEVALGIGAEFGLSRVMKGWVHDEIKLAARQRRESILANVRRARSRTANNMRMITDVAESFEMGGPIRVGKNIEGRVSYEKIDFTEAQVYDARMRRIRAEIDGEKIDARTDYMADTIMPHELHEMSPQDRQGYLTKQGEAGAPERIAYYPDGTPGHAYKDGNGGVTVSRSAWNDADLLLENETRALGSRTLLNAPKLPPHADAEAAIDALAGMEGVTGRQTITHNVGTPEEFNVTTMRVGNLDFKVNVEGKTISIAQVKRSKGAPSGTASRAMDTFLKSADDHGITVTLEAIPINAAPKVKGGLVGEGQDTLVKWYESHGFDQIQREGPGTAVVMARRPQGDNRPFKGYVTTHGRVVSREHGVQLEVAARSVERGDLEIGAGHPTLRSLERPDMAARWGTPAGRSLLDSPKNLHELEALHAGKIIDDKSGFGNSRKFFQKWLHSEQLLPAKLFDAHGKLTGRLGKLERLVSSTAIEFKRAFRGSRFADQQVNAMLAGRRHTQDLSRDQLVVIKKMRNQIDALSREAIKQGVVEGDLAVAFTESLGVYLTRSYRIFREPKAWPRIVRKKYPERIAQAKDWMRKLDPSLSEADLDKWIGDVLYVGIDSGSPIDVLRRGQLPGMSDMSSLRKRGDVPKVIRELWGEESNPVVNFLRSTTKLFHMIENHKFLNEINLRGQGTVFFPKSTGDFRHKIKVNHPALKPLEDMYTTPEIAEALRNLTGYDRRVADNMFGNAYRAVNQASKWGKTVGSQQGHIRNIMAWGPLWLSQGHLGGALRNIRTGLDIVPLLRGRLGGKSSAEWNAYVQRLAELRVIGEVPIAGELRRLSNQVINTENSFSPVRLQEATGLGKIIPALNNAYRSGDDFGKIVMFEAERARYLPALQIKQGRETVTSVDGINPATEAEVDEFVAQIVRGTTPNYSGLPRVVTDIISHAPVGDFVAFPTEMIRVLGFTLKQIEKETFSTNPEIRKIGAQRLMGLMTAATATGAASVASAYVYGYSPEERDAIRRSVPPWSRNSELIYLPRDDAGNIRYIDMGYTDPYSHGKQVIMGWLRGDDIAESLLNSGLELVQPFLNPEITIGLLSDVNKNENQRIYFETDGPAEKAMKSLAYIAREGIMPATVSQYQKILDGAISSEPKLWGPQFDPMTEAIAAFSGVRITEMDPVRTFTFSVNEYANKVDANLGIVRKVMTRPGRVTEADIRNAYIEMEGRREELFLNMEQSTFDAKMLGVSQDAMFQILEAKTNPRLAADLDIGTYFPWTPSATFLEGTKNAIAGQVQGSPGEVIDEFNRRLDILTDVARDYEDLHVPRALRRRGN